MSDRRGIIAIMGSGETTDSMVRVHRFLLDRLASPVKAAFIDTPAGFQMNADDLFIKTREYFAKRLNQPMEQAAFKSSREISPSEAERAYQTLRRADYIFVGPGSPTYALKNWIGTPIPGIIFDAVREGACFVAASAAALTLGRFTLPVYEIYKVGEDLRWEEGLDLLGRFGLPVAVIPHWNNAEGGSHDTRFCYMGEPRLARLEEMLPPEVPILGIDEHTACIVDFQNGQVAVRGIGGVTLRHRGEERVYKDGQTLPLEEFQRLAVPARQEISAPPAPSASAALEPLMARVHSFQESFDRSLRESQGAALVDILVGLDKLIWRSCKEFEDEEGISQAREALRGMIVQLGLRLDDSPKNVHAVLDPLMAVLLEIRGKLRAEKHWQLADAMRDRLLPMGIVIEDTPQGPRWHIKE